MSTPSPLRALFALPEAGRGAPLRFVASFALTSGALFCVYFVVAFPYSGLPYLGYTAYLRFYALAAGTVLHAFDPAVSVSGDVINGRASLSIVRGCDASEVLVLLSAAVLAAGVYPWRLRVLGVLAGAAAVTMANIVRICSLYCVSVYFPSAFEACHLEIWPLGLIVLAVVFFVAWARWASTRTAAAR